MDDGTSDPFTCEVCGGPIGPGNSAGVCHKTLECRRKRGELERRARGVPIRRKKRCRHPDGCPNDAFGDGWCSMHWQRIQKSGDPGSAAPARVWQAAIKAGEVYGTWTALEDEERRGVSVHCRCECGNEPAVLAVNLKCGLALSCGCAGRRTTHGLSRHPLYQCWHAMVKRCTDPAATSYADYGGRGIRVCEEWISNPEGLIKFLEYVERELGPRPDGWSLDRIDNERGYEPGNLRWATVQRQLLNRRSVAKLTRERDGLLVAAGEQAAEIAELKAELAMLRAPRPARKRGPGSIPASDALF